MPGNLSLRVIGDLGECNVQTFEFYPGEDRTMTFQLYGVDNDQRICISATAVKTMYLPGTPNTLQVNDADITVNADDSSIFSFAVTAAMSELMISGSVQFNYVVGAITRIAYLEYGQKRLVPLAG